MDVGGEENDESWCQSFCVRHPRTRRVFCRPTGFAGSAGVSKSGVWLRRTNTRIFHISQIYITLSNEFG